MTSRFLALLTLVVVAATVSAQEQRLTGDQIVERHLAAIGGREALAKIKTRVALGTIKRENDPEGQMAIMSAMPNRLSVFYEFHDYDLHMIYDGSKAFVRPALPRQISNLTDKYEEILASGLMFNAISLYNVIANSKPGDLKLDAKGTKKVNGKPAYIVQIKTAKGASFKTYFDVDTFMWVRTDFGSASVSRQMGSFTNDVVNQGGAEATADFYIETSDFRDVDGLKLPFRFEQIVTAPILRQKSAGTIVGTIKEYRNNIDIDPKMFQ